MTYIVPKIVVITPVKNEDWILDRFLSVTSRFADHIIIADQNSCDGSVDICKKYSKVSLIPNRSGKFNEAERQVLLIETARKLVPEHKIILAFDADEILAANAVDSAGWQAMLRAGPGTVLYFETPDLYGDPWHCLRHDLPRPLGYVDDGAEHIPKKIHSPRVPIPKHAVKLFIKDVKVLHYAYCRINAQRSKDRFYSVVENSMNNRIKDMIGLPLLRRRREYGQKFNYAKLGNFKAAPPEWFKEWEALGIEMKDIPTHRFYWHDLEILRYFKEYGEKRFWLEDIWGFDWEKCRLYAGSIGVDSIPCRSIKMPPAAIFVIINVFTKVYIAMRALKGKLFLAT